LSRFREASKTPLAVAGILATPLFFVALMAFSLDLDKPSRHLSGRGALVAGDPTKATVGMIYLVAFAVSAAVVLVGVLATPIRSRLAPVVPAVAAIAASILLLLPLGTWAAQHTDRYPIGVDLIPKSSPEDLVLRGEWEQNARTTAHQIGIWTIVLAGAAIALVTLLELRRRRGPVSPAVPPPPQVVAGQPDVVAGTPPHIGELP
jgi:hypothetical protein